MSAAMPADDAAPGPLRRLLFRFALVHFGLYVFSTQMASAMLVPPVASVLVRPLVQLVSARALHVPVNDAMTGSGDRLFDWVQAGVLLVVAAAGAVLWSVADRRSRAYQRLAAGFRVFLRFALAATLI